MQQRSLLCSFQIFLIIHETGQGFDCQCSLVVVYISAIKDRESREAINTHSVADLHCSSAEDVCHLEVL